MSSCKYKSNEIIVASSHELFNIAHLMWIYLLHIHLLYPPFLLTQCFTQMTYYCRNVGRRMSNINRTLGMLYYWWQFYPGFFRQTFISIKTCFSCIFLNVINTEELLHTGISGTSEFTELAEGPSCDWTMTRVREQRE